MDQAKLCLQLGLLDKAVEMVEAWKGECSIDLTGAVYKAAIKERRKAWRVIVTEEHKHGEVGNLRLVHLCRLQRQMVETELMDLCSQGIRRLKTCEPEGDRARCTQLKLLADIRRYQIDVYREQGNQACLHDCKEECHSWYKQAVSQCESLDVWDSLVLSVILNFSVFQFEILKKRRDACILTKQTIDKVIAKLGPLVMSDGRTVTGQTVDDKTVCLIGVLRDNLIKWTNST